MKLKTHLVKLAIALLLVSPVYALDEEGGLESLRGYSAILDTTAVPKIKRYKDGASVLRDYVQQPPIIPHKIAGYRIDAKTNKCLTCHSWPKYQEIGATKISLTHFKDRDGKELSDVSPRRYFCLQCHVPQADVDPLVENSFEPVEGLGRK